MVVRPVAIRTSRSAKADQLQKNYSHPEFEVTVVDDLVKGDFTAALKGKYSAILECNLLTIRLLQVLVPSSMLRHLSLKVEIIWKFVGFVHCRLDEFKPLLRSGRDRRHSEPPSSSARCKGVQSHHN
jgi:hypothetical protein